MSQLKRLLRPVSKLCAKLTLTKILSASETFDYNKHYLIRLLASPSHSPSQAIFEATVRKLGPKRMKIVGDISRINEYGKQSVCIDNSFLRKYCFCKSDYNQ